MLIKLTLLFSNELSTIFEKLEVWQFLKVALSILAILEINKYTTESNLWQRF